MDQRDRDLYYLQMARSASEAATCPRRKVGALVVSTLRRLSSGFNGAPKGITDCLDGGCQMQTMYGPTGAIVDQHCTRTVHAEINALLIAGSDAQGGTLYATCRPCYECSKVVVNSGLVRVVYQLSEGESMYQDQRGDDAVNMMTLLRLGGIELVVYPPGLRVLGRTAAK